MIHIIALASESVADSLVRKLVPPHLKILLLHSYKELEVTLKTLRIPTQLLIQRDLFEGHESSFMIHNALHHIYFFQEQTSFKETLSFLSHGALLLNWNDLVNNVWWWNKTAIESKKDKDYRFEKSAIIAWMSSSTLDQSSSLIKRLAESCSATLGVMHAHDPKVPQDSWIFCQDFDQHSPILQKKFLKDFLAKHNDKKLILNLKGQTALFECCLDWVFFLKQKGLYRLGQKNYKSLFSDMMTSDIQKDLSLEYLRYTWFAGQFITHL